MQYDKENRLVVHQTPAASVATGALTRWRGEAALTRGRADEDIRRHGLSHTRVNASIVTSSPAGVLPT